MSHPRLIGEMKMKVLDLFSGIGGFSLGLERAGMETVAFCEIEEYPCKVLAKHWPEVPIYNDVRTLTYDKLKSDGINGIDVICGGFPCQPYSTAGKRLGEKDDRALWPEMFRLIQECKPNWVIGENVAGFINMGLDNVLSDLESIGYSARAIVIPACSVNRDHWRQRVWILADSMQRIGQVGRNASGSRRESEQISWHGMGKEKASPRVVGRFDGIPNGMDRIRALGNAVVPYIPELIGRAIMEIENDNSNRF